MRGVFAGMVLMILLIWSAALPNLAIGGLFGDINGNGVVSISEVQTVINSFLGGASNSNDIGSALPGDLDGNGVVSIFEVQTVINTYLGIQQITQPVANAGTVQNVVTGAIVTLDGSGSADVDGGALTYNWAIISKPTGSNVALSSNSVVKPTFIPDVAGAYVVSLIVNDVKISSVVSTVTVNASVAVTPPKAPTNLVLTLGFSSIFVGWAPSPEVDIDHYEVYMSGDSQFVPDIVNFSNQSYSGNSYFISVATSNYDWSYIKVCAVNKSGLRSTFASANLYMNNPLQPPAGLSSASLTTGMNADNLYAWIKINFTDTVVRGADFAYYEYSVRKILNGVGGNSIQISGVKEPNYTFTPVVVGADYYIKVRAVKVSSDLSPYSNEIHIKAAIDTTPPVPPTGLSLQGGFGMVYLSWTNSTDKDLDHVQIYRSTTANVNDSVVVATSVAGTFWFDTNVVAHTNYTYWIKSVDLSGNMSAFSVPIIGGPVSLL